MLGHILDTWQSQEKLEASFLVWALVHPEALGREGKGKFSQERSGVKRNKESLYTGFKDAEQQPP